MATPLMFAFNNDDADGNISSKKLKMRIGMAKFYGSVVSKVYKLILI